MLRIARDKEFLLQYWRNVLNVQLLFAVVIVVVLVLDDAIKHFATLVYVNEYHWENFLKTKVSQIFMQSDNTNGPITFIYFGNVLWEVR